MEEDIDRLIKHCEVRIETLKELQLTGFLVKWEAELKKLKKLKEENANKNI